MLAVVKGERSRICMRGRSATQNVEKALLGGLSKGWALAEAHERTKRLTEDTEGCTVVGQCAGQALPRPPFFSLVFCWGGLYEKLPVVEGVALGRIGTFANTIAALIRAVAPHSAAYCRAPGSVLAQLGGICVRCASSLAWGVSWGLFWQLLCVSCCVAAGRSASSAAAGWALCLGLVWGLARGVVERAAVAASQSIDVGCYGV